MPLRGLLKSKKKKEEAETVAPQTTSKVEIVESKNDPEEEEEESQTESGSEEDSEEYSGESEEEKAVVVKKKDVNEEEEESEEEDESSDENTEDVTEVTEDATMSMSAPLDSTATGLSTGAHEAEDYDFFEALNDYKAEEEGDLPFRLGEQLLILEKNEDGWWTAENEKGDRGLVPSTYLKMCPRPDTEPTSPKSATVLWKNLRSSMRSTSPTTVLRYMGAVPSGFRKAYLSNLDFGPNKTYAYLIPKLSPSNLSFKDLIYSASDGKVKSLPSHWCKMVELLGVRNIPLPGKESNVLKRFLRICLFDGSHVRSNIIKVEATCADKEQHTWTFDHKNNDLVQSCKLGDIFVRTNTATTDLGVLFELSVQFVRISSGGEAEMTCGWSLLPLFEDGGVSTANKSWELNVHGGTPEEKGVLLDGEMSRTEQAGKFRALLMRNRNPRIILRLCQPSKEQKDALDLLPDTIVGSAAHISLFAYYRQLLADQLLRDRVDLMSSELMSDPFLATFPLAANDSYYMDIMRATWLDAHRHLNRQQKRDVTTLKSTFIKCFMNKVYPRLFLTPEQQQLERREAGTNPLKSPRFLEPAGALLSPDITHRPFHTDELAFNLINPHCLTSRVN